MNDIEQRLAKLRRQRERLNAEIAGIENGSLIALESTDRDITTDELAQTLSVSRQAANNYMAALVRVGIIQRNRISVDGGGRAYGYRLVGNKD